MQAYASKDTEGWSFMTLYPSKNSCKNIKKIMKNVLLIVAPITLGTFW